MLQDPDDYCTECGRPEKSRYKRMAGTTFICSICVINISFRLRKEDEEKAEKEKEEARKRKEALAKRPTKRYNIKGRVNPKRGKDGRYTYK